eukprot:508050-Pleurochrysis_carterae.AAC.1
MRAGGCMRADACSLMRTGGCVQLDARGQMRASRLHVNARTRKYSPLLTRAPTDFIALPPGRLAPGQRGRPNF